MLHNKASLSEIKLLTVTNKNRSYLSHGICFGQWEMNWIKICMLWRTQLKFSLKNYSRYQLEINYIRLVLKKQNENQSVLWLWYWFTEITVNANKYKEEGLVSLYITGYLCTEYPCIHVGWKTLEQVNIPLYKLENPFTGE